MLRLEMKKSIFSIYFGISILLLYLMFLLGNSGQVLMNGTSTTVVNAIWNKFHGNWRMCSDSSYFVRMFHMWTDNRYLPVLMPFICGMPSVAIYLEEIKTGNKKFMLSRCTRKEYLVSKIVSNAAVSILLSFLAVALYYLTLYLFYDRIPMTDSEFAIVHFVFSGELQDDVSGLSMIPVYIGLIKGVLYFFVFGVMNSSFCLMMGSLCKDKYTAFGGTVFLRYLQCRILEELVVKYISDGVELAGTLADIVNPVYLHYAGRSGFYQDKEWLALFVGIGFIVFHYLVYIWVSGKELDASER